MPSWKFHWPSVGKKTVELIIPWIFVCQDFIALRIEVEVLEDLHNLGVAHFLLVLPNVELFQDILQQLSVIFT